MGKRKQTEFTAEEQKWFSVQLSLAYSNCKQHTHVKEELERYISHERGKYEIKRNLIQWFREQNTN